MKPEEKFKSKVTDFLNTLNHCWYFKTQEMSRKGIPDIVGCLGKLFFSLELKAKKSTGKRKGEALQLYTLSKIAKTGSYAKVAHPENWEEIKKELTILSKQ